MWGKLIQAFIPSVIKNAQLLKWWFTGWATKSTHEWQPHIETKNNEQIELLIIIKMYLLILTNCT